MTPPKAENEPLDQYTSHLTAPILQCASRRDVGRSSSALLKKGLDVRRIASFLTSMVLVVLPFSVATSSEPAAQESPSKPNFVFILADDMRIDDLKYMPRTQALLRDAGMQFQSAFVSTSLCCPSRATILRGQYAHNTGVWNNGNNDSPYGGWQEIGRAHV